MNSVIENKRSHDKRKGGKKNARNLHLFQTKIDALRKEKESLVKFHSAEVETLEKAHARAIEELREMQEKVKRLTREKTQTMEDPKSDELKEETEILKRCKEDRAVFRAKVVPQVSELNEFTSEIMDQWIANRPQIEQTKKTLACLKTTKKKIEIVEQTILKEVKSKKRNKKNKNNKKKKIRKSLAALEGEDQVSDEKN
ncbi:hypothetical protein PsorP6_001028 [Peronosclerospora sorghi]|uniref:Uncharacterized protein n=1 Tax=Peronosclerospora sorghi TaxID=230839 RepID=A0ACC0WTN8_9STRA|nr:hypothetical protein PsorP6_001028 [Peronosclerospora sorghi]